MTRAGAQQVRERRIDPHEWADAVADVAGPQIVVGGPGTGKSEFLVRRALWLLDEVGVDPRELLVLSFGRRGVADLRQRIRRDLPRTIGELDVATFHSFAWRLLEAHGTAIGWSSVPQILTGPEQTAVIRELLSSEDPAAWSPGIRPLLGTTTFVAEVTDFVLRVHEQLIDDEALTQLGRNRNDWRGLPAFLARYRRELQERLRIDYGLLITEAVRLLRSNPSLDLGIHYVLVDEYQDTTASQVELLRGLVDVNGNVTAAADPYQSIYSFRGAALSNVADFPETFGAEGVTRTVLTTSFRTPAAVLDAAVRVTAGADLPGAAGPVTPTDGLGRVEARVFEQKTEEAEWVATEITRLHLSEAVPLSSIGVFVRSKRRFLPELARALARRSIPHDDPDSRLADQPAVRFVVDMVRAATGTEGAAESDRSVRRVLLGPVMARSLGHVRDIERHRIRNAVPWHEAIRALEHDADALAALLDDPSWALQMPAVAGFWQVWAGLPQLGAVVADPARREERAAWTSLGQVLSRWNERNPEATLADYVRLLEDEAFEARPLLSYRRPLDDRVTMTTLHQSKGLEFDVVFICDAVEEVFPDLRPRDSLLGTRYLLPHVPDEPSEYLAFRLQEERRLAYTAMTRAQRRVVWTATSTGAEDGRGIPSRFLALVTGDAPIVRGRSEDAERPPVTIQEAEARLRRLAADPEVAAPQRAAAATTLAAGPRWGLRPPEALRGVRARGTERGIVGPDVRLSPTQAERYELCPRLYALERRLRIGERRSLHADFGSLVHDVLEQVEKAAAERGDARSTLAEALAAFDEAFPTEDYGGGVFAAAWRDRGHDLLTRLYETWPRWGDVVALEHRLDLEIAGTAWTGRADRIEARDGIVKVIDYKTGRSVMEVAKAAESIQLGYYVLAAGADPDIAVHGDALAAELWYPARDSKKLTRRTFDPASLESLPGRLAAIAEGIRNEEWPPRPNDTCDRCAVRLVCPAWSEGGTQYA